KLGSRYRSGQDKGQESEVASSNEGHGWNVLKRGLISRRLNTYLRAAGRRRHSVPKYRLARPRSVTAPAAAGRDSVRVSCTQARSVAECGLFNREWVMPPAGATKINA